MQECGPDHWPTVLNLRHGMKLQRKSYLKNMCWTSSRYNLPLFTDVGGLGSAGLNEKEMFLVRLNEESKDYNTELPV